MKRWASERRTAMIPPPPAQDSLPYKTLGWGREHLQSKEGLHEFIAGDADVLIASGCIGTGIDKLQLVCSRMIIASLPWTHAEFEQLKGRVYRQGQKNARVQIFIPLTFSIIEGRRWSWCEARWQRIKFKKSIADAAVDGVVPEGHLQSPAQAVESVMKLLNETPS